jgi:acyl phosphate:glycerol-3-phosphate acyltransferase
VIALAVGAGYLIGSIPTARWLGLRLRGLDLSQEGSSNPGARNALRSGGVSLALVVLMVEMGKGVLAVAIGTALVGPAGAVGAGVGAIAGNLYSVWTRFSGGKGLGISGGVLLALWPTVVVPIAIVIAVALWLTKSSSIATLVSSVALLLMAVAWTALELPVGWGPATYPALIAASLGIGLLLGLRHWSDFRGSTPAWSR